MLNPTFSFTEVPLRKISYSEVIEGLDQPEYEEIDREHDSNAVQRSPTWSH